MREATRKDLIAAAKSYWRSAPWKILADSDAIGLRDEATDLMGCATVLGQAGIELGLAIHLGERGFEMARRLSDAELHRDDFAYRADFLLLSYTATRELPREHRQGPYALPAVEAAGKKFIPLAWHKPPHRTMQALQDEQASFLARALRAVPALLVEGRLQAGPDGPDRPTPMFLLPHTSGQPIVALNEAPRDSTVVEPISRLNLSEATLSALRSKTPKGRLLASLVTPPFSVQDRQVRVLVLLDPVPDQILLSELFEEPDALGQAGQRLVDAFAGRLRGLTGNAIPLPKELVTDSLDFYEHIKDALAGVGLRVVASETVPELDQMKAGLRQFLAGRGRR